MNKKTLNFFFFHSNIFRQLSSGNYNRNNKIKTQQVYKQNNIFTN